MNLPNLPFSFLCNSGFKFLLLLTFAERDRSLVLGEFYVYLTQTLHSTRFSVFLQPNLAKSSRLGQSNSLENMFSIHIKEINIF